MLTVLLFLNTLLIVAAIARPLRCPSEWTYHHASRRCYFVAHMPATQFGAYQFCQKLDLKAKLIQVNDEQENNFIRALPFRGTIWLAAKARFDIIDGEAGLFRPGLVLRWPNGKPVRYTNWDRSAKGMDSEHMCVTMNTRGKWLNQDCSSKANFVCERKVTEELHSEECPKKWTWNAETSACYRVFAQDNFTMLAADALCQQNGLQSGMEAMLTSISSERENRFINELARKKMNNFTNVIIGAIGESSSRKQWTWIDGSRFSRYQNWSVGMPRGRRKLAALVMNRDGKWANVYADRPITERRTLAVCKLVPF